MARLLYGMFLADDPDVNELVGPFNDEGEVARYALNHYRDSMYQHFYLDQVIDLTDPT